MKIQCHWGTKLVVAMVAFMLMIIAMVAYMSMHQISLVEKDYYPKGQAHQEMIQKIRNAAPYANQILVDVNGQTVRVQFPSFFRPDAVKGTIHFYHRTSEKSDHVTDLVLNSEGIFTFHSNQLKGRYILKIDWEQDGIPYHIEKSIAI